MRFLFDENMPYPSLTFLQGRGYDIEIAEDFLIGSADEVVLEIAVSNGQVLVTFDSDFGELVYKNRYRPNGVIYFRWESFRPAEPGEFLHDILQRGDIVLEGYFTVIDRGAIRQRPI